MSVHLIDDKSDALLTTVRHDFGCELEGVRDRLANTPRKWGVYCYSVC